MASIPSSTFREIPLGPLGKTMEKAGASHVRMWMVPIGELYEIEDFNPRIDTPARRAHIAHLAKLIGENGFLPSKPLEVIIGDDETICVTDGHARMHAAILHNKTCPPDQKIDRLPCVAVPPGSTPAKIMKTFVTSNSGTPLTPLETGIVCARLLHYGNTEAQVAKELDLSTQYVKDLLLLTEAPSAVKAYVINDKASAGTAIQVLREHGAAKAAGILKDALTTAAADGKDKVTPTRARAAAAATGNKPKTQNEKTVYKFKARQIIGLDELKPVATVPGDWYEPGEQTDVFHVLRNTRISVVLGPPVAPLAEEL